MKIFTLQRDRWVSWQAPQGHSGCSALESENIKVLLIITLRRHFHYHHHYHHPPLWGGVAKKCFNPRNLNIYFGQLGQVIKCPTLRSTFEWWGTKLWPKNGHFWPYLAIDGPSCPIWVEHRLNRVEHCISHMEGPVWPLWTYRKWSQGSQGAPKNGHFWP